MYYNEFRKLGIEVPNKTEGRMKVLCPKCEGGKKKEKSLSVYFGSGQYVCHRATCGWRGWAGRKDEYKRPEWKNNTNLPGKVVKYFEGRGISQKTLKEAKVSVDERGNIEFNYFRGAELINIKTRYENEKGKTFKQVAGAEKMVYNYNSIAGKKKCIIVEGEIDVLSWIQAGVEKTHAIISVDQGAGLVGSNLSGKLECIKNCAEDLDNIEEFYICTDKDAPGVYLQTELIRRFGEYRCNIVNLPEGLKDANEVLQQKHYPGSTNVETLRFCLKNSTQVEVGGIYKLESGVRKQMLDAFDNGRKKGDTTNFKELDKIFTLLAGDMSLYYGIPGMGKSQMARMLMVLKSYFQGWKWACFVPEDMPADYFFEDLCHIYVGKSSDMEAKDRMTREEFINAMEFIKDHFFLIYSEPDSKGKMAMPSNKWINERIRFLKLKHGVNAYCKDPWNKIYHDFKGKREDQYLADELTREAFFAKGFDAAFYIAHPTGGKVEIETRNNADVSKGEYRIPNPYYISGGSMWQNMMDNIICIHRPGKLTNPLDMTVQWHQQKVRKKKLVGKEGKVEFIFKPSTARYYEENYAQNGHYNPMEDDKKKIEDEDLPF